MIAIIYFTITNFTVKFLLLGASLLLQKLVPFIEFGFCRKSIFPTNAIKIDKDKLDILHGILIIIGFSVSVTHLLLAFMVK